MSYLLSSDFHISPAFNFLSRIHWPDALLLQEVEHCTRDSNTVFTLALSFNRLPPNEWKKGYWLIAELGWRWLFFCPLYWQLPNPGDNGGGGGGDGGGLAGPPGAARL